jgi:hypothetical protein
MDLVTAIKGRGQFPGPGRGAEHDSDGLQFLECAAQDFRRAEQEGMDSSEMEFRRRLNPGRDDRAGHISST